MPSKSETLRTAIVRGRRIKAALLAKAGGSLSAGGAANLLRTTAEEVESSASYLAVCLPSGERVSCINVSGL
jgi:hypothetical protein